jgi:TonB family protein
VRVDLGGARVIHRDEVEYPEAAMEKGVQGTVVVEATLDADGVVSDARVLSGPPELRKAALQSVLQWHFTHDAAGSTRQVGIAFQLPADLQIRQSAGASRLQADAKRLAEQMDKARAEAKMASEDLASTLAELEARQLLRADSTLTDARNSQIAAMEKRLAELQALKNLAGADSALTEARRNQLAAVEKQLAELRDGLASFQGAAIFAGRRLKSIDIRGLTSAARDELLAKLPVHVGDTMAEDSMEKAGAALKQFDEHLALSMVTTRDGQVEIRITAPGSRDGLEPPH